VPEIWENPFANARLKVERANEHIGDLYSRLEGFNKIDSYVIHVDYDADAECDILRLETIATVPDEFLLIIGDALHNLRSALDYVMYGLSTAPDEHTKFPIYETRDKLQSAVNGGLKSKASADVIKLIVDTIQPYETGDGELLLNLHRLNNVDKHRLLIAKTQLTFVSHVRIKDENGTDFVVPDWLIIHPHIAAYPLKGKRNVKVTYKGHATCGIVFGDGMPLQGQYIPPSLRTMSVFVNHVLAVFEIAVRQGLK
jgi:hypothetical protein